MRRTYYRRCVPGKAWSALRSLRGIEQTTRGRPRDASIDERALTATRTLLTERGFEATTVQAVAARAGLHASALYRRWPSRLQLITAAVSPPLRKIEVPPTGDLRRDLRRFVRTYLAAFRDPAARAASAGLLATYGAATETPGGLDLLALSTRPQFAAILRAAPTGEVDPHLDPDDVFDVLLGAMLARVVVPTVAARARPIEKLVDLTIRLVRRRE